jgi:DNA-binding response OmpR family regulator
MKTPQTGRVAIPEIRSVLFLAASEGFCHHASRHEGLGDFMKVLAVENNPKLLKLLTHLLEKEGFETITAEGGAEALDKYKQHKPEIICLDVLMDDISGIEVCRQIRKTDSSSVILMITSKSRDVDVAEGMAAGANDYLVKPFDLTDITARMRGIAKEIIARTSPDKVGENFDFGSLRVFPNDLRADRDGIAIALNFRDIGILGLLHQNKGKVVSAAALRDLCWTAQASSPEKAVQWYIDQLRKKIEASPESPALIKSSGDGYTHE